MGKTVKTKVTETHATIIVADLTDNRIVHTVIRLAGKVTNEKKLEKLGKQHAESMGLTFLKVASVEYLNVVYKMPLLKFIENAEEAEVIE